MFVATNTVVVATKVVFAATNLCRDKSVFVATKLLSRPKCACFCVDKNWTNLYRDKSGINICVTSTRFSCCDDILVKGRGYMNQSKSVLLMALVFPLKMEGGEKYILVKGRG